MGRRVTSCAPIAPCLCVLLVFVPPLAACVIALLLYPLQSVAGSGGIYWLPALLGAALSAGAPWMYGAVYDPDFEW